MTCFGPFYVRPLQDVVNHAERLRAEIVRLESFLSRWGDDAAERWLLGRADELDAFVADVVGDWRKGSTAEVAAHTLADYVAALHDGLAENVGARSLRCCEPAAGIDTASHDEVITRARPLDVEALLASTTA